MGCASSITSTPLEYDGRSCCQSPRHILVKEKRTSLGDLLNGIDHTDGISLIHKDIPSKESKDTISS